MNSNVTNSNERSLAILRVVLIYIILLLCALIPVYYLLDLPGKFNQGLNIKQANEKNDLSQFEFFTVTMDSIDKLVAVDKFDYKYDVFVIKLTQFAMDKVDDNEYKPLFVKIADLYGKIKSLKEYADYKIKYEELKGEKEKIDKELENTKDDLKDCKKQLEQIPK